MYTRTPGSSDRKEELPKVTTFGETFVGRIVIGVKNALIAALR